jgi:hypothetical protein
LIVGEEKAMYRIDPAYIKRKTRNNRFGHCFIACFLILMAFPSLSKVHAGSIEWYMIAVAFLALGAAMIGLSIRGNKLWMRNVANFGVELQNGFLKFNYTGGETSWKLESLRRVVLQQTSGRLRSIRIESAGGATACLEGLSRLEELALEIQSAVDPKRMTKARFFHR